MNETLLLPLMVIAMLIIFLSPTLFWMIKEIIKDRKKIKKLNFKIQQKKKDKNFIDSYDCQSRFLAELINGMACQQMTKEQQEWHDEMVKYLNDNITEYLNAKERLYGEYYVLSF